MPRVMLEVHPSMRTQLFFVAVVAIVVGVVLKVEDMQAFWMHAEIHCHFPDSVNPPGTNVVKITGLRRPSEPRLQRFVQEVLGRVEMGSVRFLQGRGTLGGVTFVVLLGAVHESRVCGGSAVEEACVIVRVHLAL